MSSDTFKHINTINSIIRMAEHNLFERTGVQYKLILAPQIQGTGPRINVHDLLRVIANSIGMLPNDYEVKTKKTNYVHLRMLGVHFLSLYRPDLSLKQLGKLMGGQDHTTIIHSRRSVSDMIETCNPEFLPKYEATLNAVTQWIAITEEEE